MAKNANEEQKAEFVKVIEDTLKAIVENGMDKKALEAGINYHEFRYREADFGGCLLYTSHSDFERGFIRAEIVSYDDLMACGTYNAAKEKGLVRLEGKDYVVQDGDIILFRFNV